MPQPSFRAKRGICFAKFPRKQQIPRAKPALGMTNCWCSSPTLYRLSPPFEQRQESAKRIAQIEQHFAAQQLRRALSCVVRARVLRLPISFMLTQKPASARDSEAFVVEQPLDAENHVHVILAIEAMSARTLDRSEHGEFGFPVTQ